MLCLTNIRLLTKTLRSAAYLLLLVVTLSGCRDQTQTPPVTPTPPVDGEAGAGEEGQEQDPDDPTNKKKDDYEVQRPLPQPNEEETPLLLTKPGHWMFVVQRMKSNYTDFVGETTQQAIDIEGQPLRIPDTPFAVRSERPVALSPGLEKRVETIVYTPPGSQKVGIRSVVRQRGGGPLVTNSPLSMVRMRPHQQHFVVLAKESNRYGFLKAIYSVNAPFSANYEFGDGESVFPAERHYRVVMPEVVAETRLPLPDNPLCWTTVAYLVWDEIDPDLIEPAQQEALIDWIQWGGQLIISGPDSMGLLQESFLAPYLPATSAGATQIATKQLAPLNTTWKIARREAKDLKPVQPWSGIKLQLRTEGKFVVGAKGLLAERRVGQGRVVLSAFQLSERELQNWGSGFENFFNAAVLRRPGRKFFWDSYAALSDGRIAVTGKQKGPPRFDGGMNTRVRYLSRDLQTTPDAMTYRTVANSEFGEAAPGSPEFKTFMAPPVEGGAASWDDFNALSNAARQTLLEAAGVSVPDSSFVLLCLFGYLVILVPLNWLLFKALGRVELAWVAAPLIAIGGTWVVVKQAQLDIGFVRAQTEVALLETQPGHDRGHLTRFDAFYTSLSTTYDLEFEEPTSLAAPFARGRESRLQRSGTTSVVFDRQERARLKGMPVSSASTDTIRSEQMYTLSGQLVYDANRNQIENRSDLDLQSTMIIKRPDNSEKLLGCWLGELDSRQSSTLSFTPVDYTEDQTPFQRERLQASEEEPESLNLEPLLKLLLDPKRLEPGEVRCVALINQVLPGVTITPESSQLVGATVLAAHLDYGPLPKPDPDANAPVDVNKKDE